MTARIPPEIVEETCRRVGAMAPRDARRAMERAARQQPALLSYTVAATEDERAPVHELTLYLYFVVLQIFETAFGARIPEVGMEALERRAEANDEALLRLESAGAGFVVSTADVAASPQPAVLQHVVATLFGRAEDEAEAALDAEEAGFVFVILNTVVDLLDDAISREA
ncbi:hypothetical protein KJ059_06355 [Myxococcota bacterium]|nr:hypothetical protein [Myxococcota bacterium]MCZ7618180.1 hypothetical protein [Myxococcota bacterium]